MVQLARCVVLTRLALTQHVHPAVQRRRRLRWFDHPGKRCFLPFLLDHYECSLMLRQVAGCIACCSGAAQSFDGCVAWHQGLQSYPVLRIMIVLTPSFWLSAALFSGLQHAAVRIRRPRLQGLVVCSSLSRVPCVVSWNLCDRVTALLECIELVLLVRDLPFLVVV